MAVTALQANGIVGAGIVGLPFAVRQSGFIVGMLLLLIAGTLTNYTVTLMIETGRHHGKLCYEKLCEHAFGRRVVRVCLLYRSIAIY